MVQFVNSLTATLVVIATAVATANASGSSHVAESVARRGNAMGNRPYAPSLYARAGFEADDAQVMNVYERELAADKFEATLEPRQRKKVCYDDLSCNNDQYCSTKSNRCYKRLPKLRPCSRDYACQSGYCGRATGQCADQKTNGRICFGANEACTSGYCSVRDNVCKSRKFAGAACIVSDGCQPGLQCVNNVCATSADATTTDGDDNPSPSDDVLLRRAQPTQAL